MLDNVMWGINFFIGLGYTIPIYLLLSSVLSIRTQKWLRFLFFCLLVACSDAVMFSGELTGTITFFLLFFAAVFLFSKNDFLTKLSIALILYPIWTAINYLTQDVGLMIWLHGFDKDMSQLGQTLLHTVTMAARIPIWVCIYRFAKKWLPQVHEGFSKVMWLVIDLICLSSFLGIITIIYHSDTETSYTVWPACAACILTDLGICYLCSYMAKSTRIAMEVDMLKVQQRYYEELEVGQRQVRSLKHDMKNHLNVLHTFLSHDETKQACQYLDGLSGEFASDLRQFCDNTMVNALLNQKYGIAKEKQILCQFQADLPRDLGISPVSLCSLVGNTLDNAIEAACKVKEISDRRIVLKSRCANGFFSYFIENSKENPVVQKSNRFQTSKKEKAAHGFGLQNVQNMVSRLEGTLDISYTETSFSVTVLIPLNPSVPMEPFLSFLQPYESSKEL